MKLLILSILWFPLTILVLFFSITTLLRMQNFNQVKAQGVSDKYTNLFSDYQNSQNEPESAKYPAQDIRILVLKKFLASYHSPLIDATDSIIKYSDLQGIDYALIPSIAMQESQGCKIIPPGSYNCWGFGIYGNNKVHFENYDDAIAAVAKTIKEAYIKKGLTNPTLLEDRWTPSSVGNWSYSVNFFIGKIRQLEKNYSPT